MKKVLLADRLPENCARLLEEAGLEVDYRPDLSEQELAEAVEGVSGIVCRSGAQITGQVLESAEALEAICRAGVGVDNIDVAAASRRGVAVMNTPGGNTVSTAEHAFALTLALARNIGPAYVSMRQGRWEKSKFVGSQLAGSVMGIIGLGRVGQEVARRALASDMQVRAYDPYVSREKAEQVGVALVETLPELLSEADYVSVHVPENEQTKGLIGPAEIELMKEGARIVNCARGSIVDQGAVVAAVKEGKLGGAAFDVYPAEPPADYEFARHDRILATPHLGASTEEAQVAVAEQAARQLADALLRRQIRNAVNLSVLPPEEMRAIRPFCELAGALGKLTGRLGTGQPVALEIACRGEAAQKDHEPIVQHGTMGFMQSCLGQEVNLISAPHLAAERGIRITSTRTSGPEAGLTNMVEVRLRTDAGEARAAGTLLGREHPRIVGINEFEVEVVPEGHLLVVFNNDMPGCVGSVGAALGDAGINIARMGVSRQQVGGNALLAFNLDSACGDELLERIRSLQLVQRVVPAVL